MVKGIENHLHRGRIFGGEVGMEGRSDATCAVHQLQPVEVTRGRRNEPLRIEPRVGPDKGARDALDHGSIE